VICIPDNFAENSLAITYTRWSRYYDALHAFKNYQAEVDSLVDIIANDHPTARSLLDVACGTGRHLALLAERFEVEGLDLNPDLLAVTAERLPRTPLHCASLETFSLDRRFDLITCLFSSIAFMRAEASLRNAIAGFAAHLEPGGLLLVEPWFAPDNYWSGTINSRFVDEPDLKIAWMYTSTLEDGLSVLDNHFLVGTPAGIENLHDKHVLGLYSDEQYQAAFRAAGLSVRRIRDDVWKRGLYIAQKPID
jgi:SAM-dependent methyltransferase